MRGRIGFLFAVSGLCGLAMETFWIRAAALACGNTVVSATAVMTVFFLCAALGGVLAGAWLERGVVRPLAAYGAAECLAAISAIACWWLARAGADAGWLGGAGAGPALLFALVLAGLPSLAAGVAFPAIAHAFVPAAGERAAVGGRFYAANLLGACAGVFLGVLALPPWAGYARAVFWVAVLQAAAGAGALFAASAATRGPDRTPKRGRSSAGAETAARGRAWAGWVFLAGSGFLTLAAQVSAMAWLQQSFDNSLYVVAAVLLVFLLGLSLGSASAAWWRARGIPAGRLLVLALVSSGLLWLGFAALARGMVADPPAARAPQAWLHFLLLLGHAAVRFGPFAVMAGHVYPLAWEMAWGHATGQGRPMGWFAAANKLGCAAGAAAALFAGLPAAGLAGTTALLGACYGLLGLIASWREPRSGGAFRAGLALALLALLGGSAREWKQGEPVHLPPGDRLVDTRTGPGGVVHVIDGASGSRYLLMNNRYRLSGTREAVRSQRYQAWIPLAFHPAPERVFALGMASGITAEAALDYPVRQLTVAEISPEVAALARAHLGEWNARLFADPRARVIVGDGRSVLRGLEPQDAILCDLFFPSQDGAGDLYSREFFALAKAKLAPGGLLCAWLPVFQMDEALAGMIVRTFLQEFPAAGVIRSGFSPTTPAIGLIGFRDPPGDLSAEGSARRLSRAAPRVREEPFFRTATDFRLLFLGDLGAVAGDFEGYALNTDDRPLFGAQGPVATWRGRPLVGRRLLEWMGKRFVSAGFPSFELGGAAPEQVVGALRAGNYLFAASVANLSLPGDPRTEEERVGQVLEHIAVARRLAPDLTVTPEDLGR